jgi:hypothetical protein
VRAEDEVQAFTVVTRHLQLRFPRVPEEHISSVVQVEQQRFATARIRDFVPLLAERAATRHLLEEPRQPARSPDGDGSASGTRTTQASAKDIQGREEPAQFPAQPEQVAAAVAVSGARWGG